jgi:hypothetical protein
MPDGTPEIFWMPAAIPFDDPSPAVGDVRVVFEPAGENGRFYCDAQWTNPNPSPWGENLVIPNLDLGAGKLSFYIYHHAVKDDANNLIHFKPEDFQTCNGGLVPLASGDMDRPCPPARGSKVYPLGSFQLSLFKFLKTPLSFP